MEEEEEMSTPPTPEKLRAADVFVRSATPTFLSILGLHSDDKEQERSEEEEIKDIFSSLVLEEMYEEPLACKDVELSFGSCNSLTDSTDFNVSELEFEGFKLKMEEEPVKPLVDNRYRRSIDNDVSLYALRIVWDWQREKSRKKLQKEDEDLVSESDVDLGEGSIQESDYPYSDYEDDLDDEEAELDCLPGPLRHILKLPLDQLPREYRELKLSLNLRRERTYEEEALYLHVVVRTKGFECPSFPERCLGFGSVTPYSYDKVHCSDSEEFERYCNQAIAEYNSKKGTLYKFKYLIKAVGNDGVDNITFALADEKYRPYVGRISVTFAYTYDPPPVVHELRVTKGEYRAPTWLDASNQEYVCELNEVFREKLPELEEKWKQKMRLK